jgi:hypothetical protein
VADTTYALIQNYLPDIWSAALWYLQQNCVLAPLVQVFTNETGDQPRKGTKYAAGTVGPLTEDTDISSAQTFARSPFGTLSPSEVGTLYRLSYNRLESDDVDNVMADLAQHIGYSFRLKIDQDLLGDIASFTGGSIGSPGGTITWATITNAHALAKASGIPGPYNCVLHEYQWNRLIQAQANALPIVVQQTMLNANQFYVGTFGDVNFYTTGVLASGTAVVGGLFNRMAIGYDIRRGITIKTFDDISLRAYEVVATHKYAHGAWRTDYGVKIVGDASAPTA